MTIPTPPAPPLTATIRARLADLSPVHLAVENESHRHNVPSGAESHFKVTIVAERFAELALVARHRLVHTTLHRELAAVHALALHTYTPAEWLAVSSDAPASPPCAKTDGAAR